MSKTEGDTSSTPQQSLKTYQDKIPSQSLSKRKAWENISTSSRSLSPSPRLKSESNATGWEPKKLWDDSGNSEKKSNWELKSDIKKLIDNLGGKSKEMSSSSDTLDTSLREADLIKKKQKRYKRRTTETQEPKETTEHPSKGQLNQVNKTLCRAPKDSTDHHKTKKSNTVKKEESKEVIQREVEFKRVGFPESSSLCIIQSCIDDPSIMCHCRKKPSNSAPALEQLSNDNNLRGYETAPNLSSACVKAKAQMEKNSSFESMLLKETVEVCTCHENKNSVVYMNHVCHCNEICDQQVEHPPVKYQPGQNRPMSLLPNYHDHPQIDHHQPRKYKTKTGKKKFSKLRNLIIKRKTITVNKNNLFHDPFYGKQGIQQNVAAPWLSNIGNCCHNFDLMEPQKNSNCCCARNVAYPTDITHQEMYATKVAAETDHHEKKKFEVFTTLKKDSKNPEKLSTRTENGLFSKEYRNSDFKKSLNDFISRNHNLKKDKIGKQIKTRLSAGADDVGDYTVTHPYPERIEVYYFDHGCAGYFRTTDPSPPLATDMLVERIDSSVSRFWASCFGVLHVITSFVIAFILQFLRFLLYSILRPLLVGVIQITSDYFFKPFLAISFNSILQPIFIFFYNIASSLKDICEVIAQAVGYFLQEIANVCHAIRLVDIKNNTRNGPFSATPSNRYQQIDV